MSKMENKAFETVRLDERDEERVSEFEQMVVEDEAESFRQAMAYWRALGFAQDELDHRTNLYKEELRATNRAVLRKAKLEYEEYVDRVRVVNAEICDVRKELFEAGIPFPQDLCEVLPVDGDLCSKLELAEERLRHLKEILPATLNDFEAMRKEEVVLSELFGKDPTPLSSWIDKIPPEQIRKDVRENLEKLRRQKAAREAAFDQIHAEIKRLFSQLGESPTSDTDIGIMEKRDHLKMETYQAALSLKYSLISEVARRQEVVKVKMEQMELLWNRLSIPNERREDVRARCAGVTTAAMKNLDAELDELNNEKAARIDDVIACVRVELSYLSSKLRHGPQEHSALWEFSENLTGSKNDILCALEAKAEELRREYRAKRSVLAIFNDWHENIRHLESVKEKRAMPDVWTNRGGALLEVEKLEKQSLKALPRLTEDLLDALKEWEKCGETFTVFGRSAVSMVKEKEDALAFMKGTPKRVNQQLQGAPQSVSERAAKLKNSSSASKIPRLTPLRRGLFGQPSATGCDGASAPVANAGIFMEQPDSILADETREAYEKFKGDLDRRAPLADKGQAPLMSTQIADVTKNCRRPL